MTYKNTVYNWAEACDRAIQTLKEKLTSVPVLTYPFFDKPFTVETDACIDRFGVTTSEHYKEDNHGAATRDAHVPPDELLRDTNAGGWDQEKVLERKF